MSYLDVPRIHFSGTFYTSIGTLNNATMNYLNGSEKLFDTLSNTTWNQNGQMQFYLRGCKIRSVVGTDGIPITDGNIDPLVGARVDSQGPYSAMGTLPDVPTSNAKLSDYDSDQQYRSQINAMWVGLLMLNSDEETYSGVYGYMEPTNLRDLGGKVSPGVAGSYSAAGNYGARLTNLHWMGDYSRSPVLSALKAATLEDGIAMRFILDLYRGQRGMQSDDFGFGRIQGTFGPAFAGELSQLAPARRLVFPTAPSTKRQAALKNNQGNVFGTNHDELANLPWMPAFGKIDADTLTLDLGPAIGVQGDEATNSSNGRLLFDNFKVGYLDGSMFTPFANGAVPLGNDQASFSGSWKSFDYLTNSGIVPISLTAGEVTACADKPLAVQIDYKGMPATILVEADDGVYIDIDPPALRVEQGQSVDAQIQYMKFGQPQKAVDIPIPLYPYSVRWKPNPGHDGTYLEYTWHIVESPDYTVTPAKTNADGIATYTFGAPVQEMDLQGPRVDMDSRINFLLTQSPPELPPTGTWNQPLDSYMEPATGLEFFTLLIWRQYTVPDKPTWDKDAGPVLQQFARLYPGMVSMLNIGDEQMVVNNKEIMLHFLRLTRPEPAYMPVTRELSDSRHEMLVKWLESL
ncbi:MAG: hypothetical protein QNK37_30170 [Acidobacteriota bacterium]|nr:hypothetical protein [Acidobacteriota bacterium]